MPGQSKGTISWIKRLAPYSSFDPFLYNRFEKDTLTSDNYRNLIVVITGDTLSAQLSALAHWSHKSRLRMVDWYLNRIKYSLCMCHFMRLMIRDLITNIDTIRELETILQGLIDLTNSSEVYAILRIRYPQCVKMRWISRSDVFPGSYLVKMSCCGSILDVFKKRDQADFKNCSRRMISISYRCTTEFVIHAFKQ
jgi:hypothetical protein